MLICIVGLRLGLIQMLVNESKDVNVQRATQLVTQAANNGAQLVALPVRFYLVTLLITMKKVRLIHDNLIYYDKLSSVYILHKQLHFYFNYAKTNVSYSLKINRSQILENK